MGDLNDDGLADLVCYNNKGNVSYAFSESQSFGSVIYLEYPLCEIDGGEFLIGNLLYVSNLFLSFFFLAKAS